MDPTASKPRRSIRSFLRQSANKVFRQAPSSAAIQQPLATPSRCQSTLPNDHTSRTAYVGSAPAPTIESVAAPKTPGQIPQPAKGASSPAPGAPRNELPSPSGAASPPSLDESPPNADAPADPALHTGQRTTRGIWTGLEVALRAMHESAGLFPPLQSAIGTFIPCLNVLEGASRSRREFEELASELTSLTKFLAQHMKQSNSTWMSGSIANVAQSIEKQAKFIEEKKGRGTARRLLEANEDAEELSRCYRQIGSLFRQLQADANLSMWSIVNDQMTNARLERLKPVLLANHDSILSEGINRRTCTANTRTALLSGLNDWSNNLDAPNLYWMNGMAGTGKTTIACSLSETLERCKQLAASFFCTRTIPECREATRIIPTIAYQLARYSAPFRSALCEMLGEEPDAGSKNMTKQFEQLLRTPLLKVKEAISNNLVVVIDALDECDDMREIELLLSILLKSSMDLPLKFFVTSRPEPEIYRRMLARVQDARATLHLHDVEKSLVQADIEVYLTEELDFMSPTPAQIKELSRRSGNLFIYAATLVRYIRPGRRSVDPHKRLSSVLAMTSQSNKLHSEIDELYTALLKAALDADDLEAEEVEDVRRVLSAAICIQEPVGVEVISKLGGLDDAKRTITALDSLRSVIHFSESSGLVSTLHASFQDFMFSKDRSRECFCDRAEYNQILARRCFETMSEQLRFNICNLESSFLPDSEVVDLEGRVEQTISPALSYTCRYWGDHLQQSAYSDALCIMANDFLSVRLLWWMEVLNLERDVSFGTEVLLKAQRWLRTGAVPPNVVKLAEDACNFVTSFAANAVSQSTPHIYISLLPFCSKSSAVFRHYWKKTRGLIGVTGTVMQMREVAALAEWKTDSAVHSVAYSPNGNCIAVGCHDGTVEIRSAYNGTPVAGAFLGHTRPVRSVAYSPDATRIVFGSDDNTLRVLSAHDGALLAGPFQGHTGPIKSVTYSPDGTHIASGSSDNTIRVWNARDGTHVAGPFQGHTDWVSSVAYSPDGSRIVSGSWDTTIRVWNASDGTLVAGPFEGHVDGVYSVAYSPDSTRIASCSGDNTIRVWGAYDGTLLTTRFQGHTDGVWTLEYSPDGSRIVSGSSDNTIRVWSAHDGVLLAGPLRGHTSAVFSVAFSPDGTRIASGSDDNTIRVWSAYSDTRVVDPVQGHAFRVSSVAYSPDGSRIVSGSLDGTILVWSAQDGTPVAAPFQGQTGSVMSVAYSPDGARIVSGSSDDTIRVWDAHDGVSLPYTNSYVDSLIGDEVA